MKLTTTLKLIVLLVVVGVIMIPLSIFADEAFTIKNETNQEQTILFQSQAPFYIRMFGFQTVSSSVSIPAKTEKTYSIGTTISIRNHSGTGYCNIVRGGKYFIKPWTTQGIPGERASLLVHSLSYYPGSR